MSRKKEANSFHIKKSTKTQNFSTDSLIESGFKLCYIGITTDVAKCYSLCLNSSYIVKPQLLCLLQLLELISALINIILAQVA